MTIYSLDVLLFPIWNQSVVPCPVVTSASWGHYLLKISIEKFPSACLFFLHIVAQLVKNLPAMWEIWVWSLNWEDPREKGKATHFSILAWRIPWTLYSMEWQRAGHDWTTFTFTYVLSLNGDWNKARNKKIIWNIK